MASERDSSFMKFDISFTNGSVRKYEHIIDLFQSKGITIGDKLRFIQCFIHSSQDNFPLNQQEIAIVGDNYLSLVVSEAAYLSGNNSREMQAKRSEFTSNDHMCERYNR